MSRFIVVCLLAVGCGGGDPTPIDAAPSVDAAKAAFGATCTVVSDTSTECASGVCTDSFNMSAAPLCSQKCTMTQSTDPTCPAGSMGMKCNMKGYCKP